MRLSKMILGTLREAPGEAELDSHKFMFRSGVMRKFSSGIYSFMPVGARVKENIETELKKIMNRLDVQKVEIPTLIQEDITYLYSGMNMLEDRQFKSLDQNKREFLIGTCYREAFVELVKNEISSYKQLPQNLYSIQQSFMDYLKPRCGTMKSREYTAFNCYGFHNDEKETNTYCLKLQGEFEELFKNLGLSFEKTLSSNFIMKHNAGDKKIVTCEECKYIENVEEATCNLEDDKTCELKPMNKVATPNIKTIEELCNFFKVPSGYFVKTIIYKVDEKVVAVMVRGDREINETKVKEKIGIVKSFELADEEVVRYATSADIGFAGPIDIKCDLLLVDEEIVKIKNFMAGANETGHHYENINYGRDFTGIIGDFRKVRNGDICPLCGGKLKIENAFDIAHISKLGTKYSEAAGAHFIDEDGNDKPIILTEGFINIDRLISEIVENNKDENGIIWPKFIAPYEVEIIIAVFKNEDQRKVAEEIYNSLKDKGVNVLLDDRDERAGAKFKDSDLIGVPIRITVGKKINEGKVEFKLRNSSEIEVIDISEVYHMIEKIK